MRIELELPDDIAAALQSPDLSRTALEAIAIEGYRSRRLGNGQLRRILGFATPMQVDAFLKEHNVYMNYTMEELEKDLRGIERAERTADERRQRTA
jgi:Uncharacterised protein family (UPF0175)